MARPCGCGGGGLTVRCSNGVRCTGLGTTTEPLTIQWEIPLGSAACSAVMDCVGGNLGQAFTFDRVSKRIDLKLDPDPNNLAKVGPAGLLVTGTVTPGSGGASVAKLLTLPRPVIGGSYGAGISMWPEGMRYSYEAAAQLVPEALSLVHVPVRRTSELLPVCLHSDAMSFYNPIISDLVITMDAAMMKQARMEPGGPDNSSNAGYFGFGALADHGPPMLSDIFNLLGNKTVLYLENKDAVAPIDTVDRIKQMMPAWDVSKSIIVAGEPLATAGTYPTILHATLASMAGTGVPVAAHLTSNQQVLDYNGALLANMGVKWVSIQYGIIDDEGPSYIAGAVQDYKDNGLEVMVHSVHRQWHYDKSAANDVRGILCFDPIYATGVRSRYRYRRDANSYTWRTPTYGLHSSYSAHGIAYQKDYYRGYIRQGASQQLVYDARLQNPGVNGGFDPSGYWVLHGRMGPFRNADKYAMQCWVWWDQIINDRVRWAGLWFDRPTDRSLSDWSAASRHTVGYNLTLDQNGTMVCTQYDGTPANGQVPPPGRTDFFAGPSGYGALQARVPYGIRIEVEPTEIRGYRIGTNPWATILPKTQVFRVTNTNPAWVRFISGTNKGYPFFGRHFFEDDPGWSTEVRIIRPSVDYNF